MLIEFHICSGSGLKKSQSYVRKSTTIIMCISLVSFPLGLHCRFSRTIYKNSCVIARAKYSLKRNEIKNVGDWGLSQNRNKNRSSTDREGREERELIKCGGLKAWRTWGVEAHAVISAYLPACLRW